MSNILKARWSKARERCESYGSLRTQYQKRDEVQGSYEGHRYGCVSSHTPHALSRIRLVLVEAKRGGVSLNRGYPYFSRVLELHTEKKVNKRTGQSFIHRSLIVGSVASPTSARFPSAFLFLWPAVVIRCVHHPGPQRVVTLEG